jgi:hypothetical protein
VAVVQADHPEPSTLQPTSTSDHDLSALLNAIPSTVHVENLAFTVQQNHVHNSGPDVAAMQAYIQQADGMIAELHALRQAQFAEHQAEH